LGVQKKANQEVLHRIYIIGAITPGLGSVIFQENGARKEERIAAVEKGNVRSD